jgi:hypothetical protein
MNHKSMQVRCTMDEPLQLLMDKLASKSSELYIFWVLVESLSKTTTSSIMPIMTELQKYSVFSRKTKRFESREEQGSLILLPPKKYSTKRGASSCKKAWRTSKLK